MKWLVTSFEPFAGADTNSSAIVIGSLGTFNGSVVKAPGVPVEFGRAWSHVSSLIPGDVDGVLALGQAESRAKIGLERVALNWQDARIKDNAGVEPKRGRIEDGPDMYWCSIPWDDFELSAHVERSYSAGTFVCNELMFHLAKWAATTGKLAGFVHIPALESQSHSSFLKSPKMPDQVAVKEVSRIIEFLVAL